MTREDLIDRFAGEMTRVVGALLETAATRKPATARIEDGFAVTIDAGDADCGTLIVAVARRGAETLAGQLNPGVTEITEASIVELLKDLCGQALTAIDEKLLGVPLSVTAGRVVADLPDPASGMAMEIVVKGQEHGLYVALSGDLEVTGDRSHPGRSKTLDVIMDIDLPLVVRFGRTELPLKMLTTLGPGSVIDLGRAPDDPVEVLISNRVVARGEVVIVGGNYGVRIRDVVSPAERARSLEGQLA
jgi:flagellar motor switch protein FliN